MAYSAGCNEALIFQHFASKEKLYQAAMAATVDKGDEALRKVLENAVQRGASVIGSGSAINHSYLRPIGVEPVVYGDHLVRDVRKIVPTGVDAVLDCVGRGAPCPKPAIQLTPTVIVKSFSRRRPAAMSALARNIEDAPPIKMTQSTQPSL